jgi:hypothetical protein
MLALAGLVAASTTLARAEGEISGYGGLAHLGGTHGIVGGMAGTNVMDRLHLFGEFNYVPLGSSLGASAKMINFGGGVQFKFGAPGGPFDPYVAGMVGNGRTSAKYLGISASENSIYAGMGAGFRYRVGSNWGIRPELRYQRYLQHGGGNMLQVTAGIYYQFGLK